MSNTDTPRAPQAQQPATDARAPQATRDWNAELAAAEAEERQARCSMTKQWGRCTLLQWREITGRLEAAEGRLARVKAAMAADGEAK